MVIVLKREIMEQIPTLEENFRIEACHTTGLRQFSPLNIYCDLLWVIPTSHKDFTNVSKACRNTSNVMQNETRTRQVIGGKLSLELGSDDPYLNPGPPLSNRNFDKLLD